LVVVFGAAGLPRLPVLVKAGISAGLLAARLTRLLLAAGFTRTAGGLAALLDIDTRLTAALLAAGRTALLLIQRSVAAAALFLVEAFAAGLAAGSVIRLLSALATAARLATGLLLIRLGRTAAALLAILAALRLAALRLIAARLRLRLLRLAVRLAARLIVLIGHSILHHFWWWENARPRLACPEADAASAGTVRAHAATCGHPVSELSP